MSVARAGRWLAPLTLAACFRTTPEVQLPEPLPAAHRAASPWAAPLDADAAAARDRLDALLRAEGLNVERPWVLQHALLALGPTTTLADGRPALDALIARWARSEGGEVTFPREQGGGPVEPHRDLILKTAVELDLPPTHPIEVAGGATTLAALYRSRVAHLAPTADGIGGTTWNDAAWSLHAVASWTPPHATWTTAEGAAVGIDSLSSALVRRLAAETAAIRASRASGMPMVKDKQGIFAYTCGGAHLLQAAMAATAAGHGMEVDRATVVEEIATNRWRLGQELAMIDGLLAEHPEHATILLVQRMKFLGHWLEGAHRAGASGLVSADDPMRDEVTGAQRELVATVQRLVAAGVFDRLDEVKAQRSQTWLDLLGDGAHALHALRLGEGSATVVW